MLQFEALAKYGTMWDLSPPTNHESSEGDTYILFYRIVYILSRQFFN
jgi:hypothetical protein